MYAELYTVLTQMKVVFYIRLGPPIILRTTFLIFFPETLRYSRKFNWVSSHDNAFIEL